MEIKIINVEKGNSLFDLIISVCHDEADGDYNPAIHRLCSLMRKSNVKTAIVENLSEFDENIRNEVAALRTYFDRPVPIRAYRATFIAKTITEFDDIQFLPVDSFLSSSIIINFKYPKKERQWKSYLYSSIIAEPRINENPVYGDLPLLNNYIHVSRSFRCPIVLPDKVINFTIRSTFFCQQNSVTSVCANASLCMVINNSGDLSEITYPEDINKILLIDHKTKRFGSEKSGFSDEELEKVLANYGLSFEKLNFFKDSDREYNEWIYNYIESRCPVLLIFSTTPAISHVVPLLGHTLNSDTWRPEAELAYSPAQQQNRLKLMKSSAQWVDHFIIHDDNFGMYFCLPVDSLKRVTLPSLDPSFRALYALAIIPKRVKTPSWEAEWASRVLTPFLQCQHAEKGQLDVWSERVLNRIITENPVVARTFLTSKRGGPGRLDRLAA